MAKKKSKSKRRKQRQELPKVRAAAKAILILKITMAVTILAAIGGFAYLAKTSKSKPVVTASNTGANSHTRTVNYVGMSSSIPIPTPKVIRKAKSLNDLLAMGPEQLARVDIAEMNLLCASDLPGAEDLNIDHCLATLNLWAARVKHETDRHLYRVTDPRYAKLYKNSEAYFRAYLLLQTLQQDLAVKYDMSAVGNFSFKDSRVAFIHGMIPAPGKTIDDTPGGTCASMPVLYVAVGRRLGYPLKLATTKGHIFVRWDGRNHSNLAWRERFNIEGSGEGFSSFPDDYYRTWPLKTTDREVRIARYLASLSPTEEFAEFLAARGHCAKDNNQLELAARCFENAYRADNTRPSYRAWFTDAAIRCGYRPKTPALAQALARHRSRLAARRYRKSPMVDPLAEVRRINTMNRATARQMRQQTRLQQQRNPQPGYPRRYPYQHRPYAPGQPPKP